MTGPRSSRPPSGRPLRWLRHGPLGPWARRLAVAGLGLAALGPFTTLYADGAWIAHALALAVVTAAVSLALSPRWPPAVAIAAAVAAVVAFETVVVRHRTPTGTALVDTWVELARSWDALLAAGRPAPGDPATSTFPALLVAVAVFAAAELDARGRWAALTPAVAVVAFGVAGVLAAPATSPLPVVLLLAAGMW